MRALSTRSRRTMALLRRVTLRSSLLAALIASPACVCQQEGCESFESLSVTIPLSESELDGAALEVCRNDECFMGVFTVAEVDWSDSSHPEHEVEVEAVEPANSGNHRANCYLSRTDDGFSLIFEWYPAGDGKVARGDVLRVSVDSASGGEPFTRDATVTAVEENYPNGEECDATPCLSATLKG